MAVKHINEFLRERVKWHNRLVADLCKPEGDPFLIMVYKGKYKKGPKLQRTAAGSGLAPVIIK